VGRQLWTIPTDKPLLIS